MTSLLLVALVLVLLFAGIGALWWVRRLAKVRRDELLAHLTEDVMILENGANFYGRRLAGVTQTRGNGTLALTSSRVVFLLWMPRKLLEIPLEQVVALRTPKSFLGKTRLRPLLEVVFINTEGEEDSMAWELRTLEPFQSQLQALLNP